MMHWTKKETRVLCSDKIKTADVTCLPLDVSDHTGTTYMHQSDYLAQNTGNDSVFKYCSRQSSFLLTGLTPWLSEYSSCKHRLCFSRCCASHAETLLNVHFWVYRSIYNFFTQKKAPIYNELLVKIEAIWSLLVGPYSLLELLFSLQSHQPLFASQRSPPPAPSSSSHTLHLQGPPQHWPCGFVSPEMATTPAPQPHLWVSSSYNLFSPS